MFFSVEATASVLFFPQVSPARRSFVLYYKV